MTFRDADGPLEKLWGRGGGGRGGKVQKNIRARQNLTFGLQQSSAKIVLSTLKEEEHDIIFPRFLFLKGYILAQGP